MTTNHKTINIANGFRLQYEKAQQGYVLLFPEGLIQLNEPSAEILKLCDGKFSQEQVVSTLVKKFPDDNVEQDVREFLAVAFDKGWIYEG